MSINGDLDFNEITFGRDNPTFINVGPYTPPVIKSPKQNKSKREMQLERRLRNNPELLEFTLSDEEKKKMIPIPKKKKGAGRKKTKKSRKTKKTRKTKKFRKTKKSKISRKK